MSKFKVGDKVRRLSGGNSSTPVGFEGKIKRIEDEGDPITEKLWFSDMEWGYNDHPAKWELVTEGPVRTVTRREIVPGQYDRLIIRDVIDDGKRVIIRFAKDVGDCANLVSLTADELRSAAMILSQIAEALDDKETTK